MCTLPRELRSQASPKQALLLRGRHRVKTLFYRSPLADFIKLFYRVVDSGTGWSMFYWEQGAQYTVPVTIISHPQSL